MTERVRIDRRELLLGAAAWAVAAACGRAGSEVDQEMLEAFGERVGSPGCGRIADAYLAGAPAEASPDALARAIRERLAGTLPDPAALERAIRADFAEQETVVIEGWVLSRTECRLCALVRLARG